MRTGEFESESEAKIHSENGILLHKIWEIFRREKALFIISYFLSMGFHLIVSMFYGNILVNFLGFVLGTTWVIILPGFSLAILLYQNKKQPIWIILLLGIMFNCISIQIAFLLNLGFALQIQPQYIMILMNTLLVISATLRFTKFQFPNLSDTIVLIKNRKFIIAIIVIGLLLRLVLLVVGIDSIAPDACMYSDYARNILDGQFSTHVLNDARIYNLSNNIQYSFHQTYVYLAAISFFIVDPAISGPIPIIFLSGLILVGLGYQISARLFDERAGYIAASIILLLPIFVFFSSFAYGPEITSLTFILGGISLLIQDDEKKSYISDESALGWSYVFTSPPKDICIVLPVIESIQSSQTNTIPITSWLKFFCSNVYMFSEQPHLAQKNLVSFIPSSISFSFSSIYYLEKWIKRNQ